MGVRLVRVCSSSSVVRLLSIEALRSTDSAVARAPLSVCFITTMASSDYLKPQSRLCSSLFPHCCLRDGIQDLPGSTPGFHTCIRSLTPTSRYQPYHHGLKHVAFPITQKRTHLRLFISMLYTEPACLHVLLSTRSHYPYEQPPMTRSRDEWVALCV